MTAGVLVTKERSEIIRWEYLSDSERANALERALEQIQSGQVVLLPSETRYALVARADSEEALDRLLAIKGRPGQQPISVFVQSTEHISEIAQETPVSIALSSQFLPGPLTLILTARKLFPSPVVTNGGIGIRVSSDPIIQSIAEKLHFPLTATSANRSGMLECTTVEEIFAQLGDQTLLAIDDGPRSGQTSTVVDARSERAVILREGAIGRDEIERVTRTDSKKET